MQPKRLESNEERRAVAWAEKHGIICLKLNLQGNAGWPDRLFVFPRGVTVWMEFKRCGEVPRPLQWARMRQLIAKGHNVYSVDSYEAAIEILGATALHEDRGETGR